MLTGAAPAEGDGPATSPPALQPSSRGRRFLSVAAKAALSLIIGLMLLIGAIGFLLDTDLGHRLILDRIAAIAPESGLRIRVGRIGGSIWGRTELRDVRLYDPDGLFAEAPEMAIEWQPFAWLWSRLLIHEAASDLIIVHRPPHLLKSPEPTLPRYDIHVGRLDIAQLRFEPAVTGTRRSARVTGEAEYRRGRFLLDLDARMRGGGDRLSLLVDSAPDRGEFDLDMTLDAPADGVLARMLGAQRPLHVEASGDGDWRRWAGTATMLIDGRPGGELRLSAASGRYAANGWVSPAPLLAGTVARLAGERMLVSADGRFDEGVLDGRLAARSAAMRVAAAGAADLRQDRYRDVHAVFELFGATPLLAGVAAPGAQVTALVDGPFDDASVVYRATAPRLLFGGTILEGVQASGSGRWTEGQLTLPIAGRVARVGGAGDAAAALLSGVRIGGTISAADGRLSSQALDFASQRMRGRIALRADLASGRYAAAGTASAQAVRLSGIGTADLEANLRATSAAPLSGTARGLIRRIDNAALAWAAGGPLRIESGLAGGDGGLRFPNMRLTAPSLQLSGAGSSAADGALHFEGSGRQAALGPLALRIEGSAERPRLLLRLARPARSLGLANVSVALEPAGANYAYRAAGGSPLGPFNARGTVNRSGAVSVSPLNVSGATANGTLHSTGSGVSGTLNFAGALAGPVAFGTGGGQTIEAHLIAIDARLGRVPVGSGRIDANLVVDAGGGPIQGRVRFAGVADRLWSLVGTDALRLSGPLALDAEIGGPLAEPTVRGTMRLSRGRLVAGGRALEGLEARGTFDRERLMLESVTGSTGGGGHVRAAGTVGFDGALALRIAGERIEIAERGLDSRWNATLAVRGSAAAPALFGEATLVSGTYRVLGRPVELTSGTMRFDGETPPDPRLDLVARPSFGPAIRITGRASRPEIGIANPFSRREEPETAEPVRSAQLE